MNMMVPPSEPIEMKRYTGPERAAALMLVLGKEHGAPMWEHLSVEEIKDLSSAMAQLGRVPASVAEHLLVAFSGEVGSMNRLHGSFETTERLLTGILPNDRVREIMEDIPCRNCRARRCRSVWRWRRRPLRSPGRSSWFGATGLRATRMACSVLSRYALLVRAMPISQPRWLPSSTCPRRLPHRSACPPPPRLA